MFFYHIKLIADDSIFEKEKKNLFNDYNTYEKNDWEFYLLNNASFAKNNFSNICDLNFNIYFTKQKLKLILAAPISDDVYLFLIFS